MNNTLSALAVACSLMAATSSSAATIGVAGADPFSTFLNSNGNTSSSVALTAAGLAGLDTLILNRTSGNQAVIDFVAGGGLLITEWNASAWALNTANLLNATDSGGGFIATGTTISFSAAGQATNLDDLSGTSYNTESQATEFFRTFTGIGAGVDVLATRPGDEAVILGGSYGLGNVLIMGYDWQDQGYSGAIDTGNEQVLLQAVNYDGSANLTPVPLPATLPLLVVALGGMGLAARRRKSA